jgi:sugar lactone lactonase YvrE
MKAASFILISAIAFLAGCGGGVAPSATVSGAAAVPFGRAPVPAAKPHAHIYWTLYAGTSLPQVQIAKVPMRTKSKVKSVDYSSKNDLLYTSGLGVDSEGRLWILSFGQYSGNPTSVLVFDLPLKSGSLPRYTFVLSGTSGADALAFDPSGNLWVTSPGNSSVMEYAGPFNESGTLSAAIAIQAPPSYSPAGIAIDASANVYVSNFNSTGTNSIGVLAPPYNGYPFFLNGLTAPGGLAFDKQGDLYASSNGSKPAVVRYDSNDLQSGDKPSIVDAAGLPANSYEAAFTFTKKGDLYAANCGDAASAGIDVWPLSREKFGATLKPSVLYTNADIQSAACAWGIAVK